ncbi:MAG: hypothetical protein R3F56_24670 [Planctomycetota bacterium]
MPVHSSFVLLGLLLSSALAKAQVYTVASGPAGNQTTLQFQTDSNWGVVPTAISRGAESITFRPTRLWSVLLESRAPGSTSITEPPCTGTVFPQVVASETLTPAVSNPFQQVTVTSPNPNQVVFTWTSPATGGQHVLDKVEVTVTGDASGDFLWSMRVEQTVGAGDFGVSEIELPYLLVDSVNAGSYLYAAGVAGGRQIVDPEVNAFSLKDGLQQTIEILHPAPQGNLPLQGLSDDSGHVLISMCASDTDLAHFSFKRMTARGQGQGNGVAMACARLMPDPFTAVPVVESLPVRIALLAITTRGKGWWDLAAWYRELREASGWLQRGKISELIGLERARFDFDFAFFMGHPDANQEGSSGTPSDPPSPDFASWIGYANDRTSEWGIAHSRALMVWYDWFDALMSEVTPIPDEPRDSQAFWAALTSASAEGYRVLPYTRSHGYKGPAPGGSLYPCYHLVQGNLVYEKDGTKAFGGNDGVPGSQDPDFVANNLAVTSAVDYMDSILYSSLIAGYPISGVYMDAMPYLVPSFNVMPGHAVGGGPDTADGARDLMNRIAMRLANKVPQSDGVLLSEIPSEATLNVMTAGDSYPQFNFGDLSVSGGKPQGVGVVPILRAVYGEYQNYYGYVGSDVVSSVFFDAVLANPEAYGSYLSPADIQNIQTAWVDMWAMRAVDAFTSGVKPVWTWRGSPDPDLILLGSEVTPANTVVTAGNPAAEASAVFGRFLRPYGNAATRAATLEGRMMPPMSLAVGVIDPAATLQNEAGTWYMVSEYDTLLHPIRTGAVPKVLSNVFRSADGTIVVVLGNWTASDTFVDYVMNPANYGIDPSTWTAEAIYYHPNGQVQYTLATSAQQWLQKNHFLVPARTPMVIQFHP